MPSSPEAGNGGIQVVDDNADIVHPLKRHGDSPSSSRSPLWPLVHLGRSQHHILDNELSCFLQALRADKPVEPSALECHSVAHVECLRRGRPEPFR
jgi:hypothetical protein